MSYNRTDTPEMRLHKVAKDRSQDYAGQDTTLAVMLLRQTIADAALELSDQLNALTQAVQNLPDNLQ